MYYYLIIALQVFCIYHLYKNKNQYYWFFIILFLPLFGCLIYIFTQVINKSDVSIITEEISTIINPTKKIRDLQDQLQFSNTFQNQIFLADAYLENSHYTNAILNYEEALQNNFKDDPHTLNKLITCYFNVENFDKVIEYAAKINLEKDFMQTVYYYGLALEKKGDFDEAEIQLRKIDKRYSNYEERLVLSKFLIRRNKNIDAKEILNEILLEAKNMTKMNRRNYRFVISETESLIKELD